MRKLLSLIVIFHSGLASAMTGNELYDFITSQDNFKRMGGINYIRGILEAEAFHYHSIKDAPGNPIPLSTFICMPTGSTYEQAQDIVKKFQENYPQLRHHPASAAVITALHEVWPCKG